MNLSLSETDTFKKGLKAEIQKYNKYVENANLMFKSNFKNDSYKIPL